MSIIGGILGTAIIGLSFFMLYRLISSYLPDSKQNKMGTKDDIQATGKNGANSEKPDTKAGPRD